MKTFWKRIWAESPAFFKKLKYIAISLAVSAAAVLGAIKLYDLTLPAIVTTICTYVIIAGAACAGTAQLPVVDSKKLDS
jgi:hypothetical protein